ncbi:Gfo/Idh/MocA family oxidoreductase [Algoriphagus sediminis]|uniref:Gfo/Idh/MocA family oxidoreductase n=1 Tax=Algoriphagus sediminis TaxID=3057113 RepID=A0ABT7YDR0_9BACT|nr:Gfo/Idh/MocA family oxidoreductase [Algoriphagus sediminis]MDN3204666.1 Gfo/Idh/MocA family oxidoreductase [Algoriphagus sediminis]
MDKKSVVIYGFGRMGLTHYAILNQLLEDANYIMVDSNKLVNSFARNNIKAMFFASDVRIKEPSDFTLICTPPMFHLGIIRECISRGDSSIFVEKPFGGVDDNYEGLSDYFDRIKVGYVLRFVPVIQWIKKNLPVEDVVAFRGSYFSNTIEKKPNGWRNGPYSGVSNEMGSHILDLAVYTLGLDKSIIEVLDKRSIVSDVDDIVSFDIRSKNIDYSFHFDWVNKNYRKPVFKLVYEMNDGSKFIVDQQKVEHVNQNDQVINKITTVDISKTTEFYLRGVEFSDQMKDFTGDQKVIGSVEESLITREIIKNVIEG